METKKKIAKCWLLLGLSRKGIVKLNYWNFAHKKKLLERQWKQKTSLTQYCSRPCGVCVFFEVNGELVKGKSACHSTLSQNPKPLSAIEIWNYFSLSLSLSHVNFFRSDRDTSCPWPFEMILNTFFPTTSHFECKHENIHKTLSRVKSQISFHFTK